MNIRKEIDNETKYHGAKVLWRQKMAKMLTTYRQKGQ